MAHGQKPFLVEKMFMEVHGPGPSPLLELREVVWTYEYMTSGLYQGILECHTFHKLLIHCKRKSENLQPQ